MKKMKKLFKKLNSKQGYTLVELLTAMVIVILIGLMVSTGMTVGLKVQKESIFVANSDMLAGTLNTAISDVLRYSEANYVSGDIIDGKVEDPKFTNKEYSIKRGFFFVDSDGYLAISKNGVDPAYEPDPTDSTDVGPDIGYLISNGVYSNKLVIRNFTISYDVDKKIYTGSYKIKEKTGTAFNKDVSFTFRTVAT